MSVNGISRLPIDSLLSVFSFSDLSDLGKLCQVSQGLQTILDSKAGGHLWEHLSILEGVPLVEMEKSTNPKLEFQFLRIRTFARKIIGKYLGEAVEIGPQGEVKKPQPRYIRFDLFKQLRDEKDPFDSTEFMRDNYVVSIPPRHLKIQLDLVNRPLTLNASGTSLLEIRPLTETTRIEQTEITFPFSFQNLRMLTQYPLEGAIHGPIFKLDRQRDERSVFDQCNIDSPWDQVSILRKKAVAADTSLHGDQGQKKFVESRGWKIAPVCLLGLVNALQILKSGNLPGSSYAQSDEMIRDPQYPTACVPLIGGFSRGRGLNVYSSPMIFANDGFSRQGVIPGLLAEVQDTEISVD